MSNLGYLAVPGLTIASFFAAELLGIRGVLFLWVGYGIGFFQAYEGMK